ncbi:MAG: carboxypeptidase-like regulatory domain-containing protein [Thermoanaerobaculia bacterium]
MTFRSPLFRTLCVAALCIVGVTASFAAQTSKRRAVKPGGSQGAPVVPPADVILTGDVVDSVTNAPVVGVQVSTPGKSGRTDAAGHFAIRLVAGQNFTLQFVRSGYETLSVIVNITTPVSQTFRMNPKPTTTVKLTSGKTYELDTETVEFGYVLSPFSAYNKDTKLNLCKAGGESFMPDRSEIRKITTGAQINDRACCSSGPLPAITIELKAGGTATAGFADACVGYKVDLIALEHATATPIYLHFSDIAEVTLP